MINISFKKGSLEKIMRANARKRAGWRKLEKLGKMMDLPGNKVLDIGIHGDVWPGGHKYMFENAKYETLDIDPQVQPTHVGDIRDTGFEGGAFDMVICHSVIEHILEDRGRVYPEIYRILKKGGVAVLVVPSTLERESEPAKLVTYRELVDNISVLPGVEYSMDKLKDGNYFIEILK